MGRDGGAFFLLPGVAKRVVHTHVLLAAPGAALWPRPGTGGCSPSAPSTSPVLASPQHPAGIFQLWGKKTPRLCVMEKWQNGRVEKKKTCPEQGAGDKEGSGSVRSRAASATTWRWHRERGASSAAFRHGLAGCVGPAAPQNPLCFPKSRGLGWATLLQPHPGDVSPAAAPFSPLAAVLARPRRWTAGFVLQPWPNGTEEGCCQGSSSDGSGRDGAPGAAPSSLQVLPARGGRWGG